MIKKKYTIILFVALFLAKMGSAQVFGPGLGFGIGVGVYGPYLSSVINIHYLQEPNKKPTSLFEMTSDFIKKIGTLSLFGTNGNNGMDHSAELVDALFKSILVDPSKSISKSAAVDTKFQETVYHALRLKPNQKFRLFFINDKAGITDEYLKEYRFFYKEVPLVNYKFVWPGVFNDPVNGATVVIGESVLSVLSLQEAKKLLISLLVQMCLDDYGPAKSGFQLPDISTGSSSSRMGFATSDRRRIEYQAIANAFILSYSDKYRDETYEWFTSGSSSFLPVSEADLVSTSDEGAMMPVQRFSLRDKFLSINTADTGFPLPAYLLPGSVSKNWVYYNTFSYKGDKTHLASYYSFQNDLLLGCFYYQFIRAFGIGKFVECILYDNKKLLTVKPGMKTISLIQNVCLLMMGDKNVQYIKENPGTVEAQNAIFPLASFSIISGLGFKSADAAAFKKSLQLITEAPAIQQRGAFDDLVNLFVSDWQKKILAILTPDAPVDNEDGYIFNKTAKLARILGIK